MITQIVEVINKNQNWGKFLIGKFNRDEWDRTTKIGPPTSLPLLVQRGWATYHRLVLDIETGEAVMVSPGGSAHADLNKHQIWVCPMFEPFLEWWYKEWPAVDVGTFPDVVQLPDAEFQWAGYRRPGGKPDGG